MVKIEDGLYVQIYALKDGVPYVLKTLSLGDVAHIFTNKVLEGVEEMIDPAITKKEGL